MALLIRGETTCPICGKVIEEGQPIRAFSAFVADATDELSFFSDAAFHEACFMRHPLSRKADHRWTELVRRTGPGNRFCGVCGREITDPDDYFATGYLTGDENSPLYPYNYTQFHRSHLRQWPQLRVLLHHLDQLQQSRSGWGPGLEWLRRELESARGLGVTVPSP